MSIEYRLLLGSVMICIISPARPELRWIIELSTGTKKFEENENFHQIFSRELLKVKRGSTARGGRCAAAARWRQKLWQVVKGPGGLSGVVCQLGARNPIPRNPAPLLFCHTNLQKFLSWVPLFSCLCWSVRGHQMRCHSWRLHHRHPKLRRKQMLSTWSTPFCWLMCSNLQPNIAGTFQPNEWIWYWNVILSADGMQMMTASDKSSCNSMGHQAIH